MSEKATTLRQQHSSLYRAWKRVIWFALDQWFLIALGIEVAISSQYQVPLNRQALRRTVVSYGAVATIFLIIGLTLKTRVLMNTYTQWPVHLYIQVQCFLLTSATVFGVVSATATNPDFMSPGLLIGLILLGCLPTTLSSNTVMCAQAHGNEAMTVVQTTLGSTLAPFLSPVLLKLYLSNDAWYVHFLDSTSDNGFGEVYRRVFKQLGLAVYLPLAVGQVIRNTWPNIIDKIFIRYKLKKLSSIALLIIIWQTFDQAFATKSFQSVKPNNIIFIVFIDIALFLLWLTICFVTSKPWLPKRDVIAIAYCVPAKTPAIGIPLVNVIYAGLSLQQQSQLQIPLILFQGLQICLSSLLTILFRRWVRPDEEREDTEKTLNANPGPEELSQGIEETHESARKHENKDVEKGKNEV